MSQLMFHLVGMDSRFYMKKLVGLMLMENLMFLRLDLIQCLLLQFHMLEGN